MFVMKPINHMEWIKRFRFTEDLAYRSLIRTIQVSVDDFMNEFGKEPQVLILPDWLEPYYQNIANYMEINIEYTEHDVVVLTESDEEG